MALIRADFPVLERRIDDQTITYLDNAATSLKPRQVINSITSYYELTSANIHRGKHFLSEEASDKYENVRHQLAQFLDVKSSELIFCTNATEALNMVAYGLRLTKKDLVLVGLDSHHSNMLPWFRVARTELIRLDQSGRLDMDHYRSLLGSRPKVVAFGHCSNVTGLYQPAEELSRMAQEAGAIVVLDAAQSVPHRRVRPSQLGVNFLAFSAHKMMGPTGVGVLYGETDSLSRLEPLCLGGGVVDWVDTADFRLRKLPHRFEAGTPNISGVLGLGAAISYIERLGLDVVRAHDVTLAQNILKEAIRRPYLRIVGSRDPGQERSAIVSVAIDGYPNLSDMARVLSDSYGVMCRTGHMCAQPLVDSYSTSEVLRFSAYVYNTAEEIGRAFEGLDEAYFSLGAKTASQNLENQRT